MTAQEYRKMLEVDFSDTNISEMPDLAKVKINPDKSQIERQKEYKIVSLKAKKGSILLLSSLQS